jgi:hypothetical protein
MCLRGAQRRSIPWWRCDTSNHSQIPQHDSHAAEADHAEKVLDVIFVARDQSPEPLQPGIELVAPNWENRSQTQDGRKLFPDAAVISASSTTRTLYGAKR